MNIFLFIFCVTFSIQFRRSYFENQIKLIFYGILILCNFNMFIQYLESIETFQNKMINNQGIEQPLMDTLSEQIDQIQIVKQAQQVDPLRVVIIGLSWTGKKLVANMLEQKYGFKVLKLKPQEIETTKSITKLCFDDYHGRALVVLEKVNFNLLKNLKKRNFVNIILVEASALKRYQNFLIETGTQNTPQQMTRFLKKDDLQNDQQFEKCLQFVKTRICNRQGLTFLQQQISTKMKQIIKPFRPSWEDYFMKMADIARRRSNCMKSSVGAVIVNSQNRVISTGYNGTARGLASCFKDGCGRCNSNSNTSLDQCLCLHAQESAIIEVGINRTKGCHLYTTLYPCFSCAKVIKQAGIAKIFYFEDYDKEDSGKAFIQSNFDVENNVKQVKIDNIYY